MTRWIALLPLVLGGAIAAPDLGWFTDQPPHAVGLEPDGQASQAPQMQTAPGPVPPRSALQFTQLAEDTTVTTPSGASFMVSKGWHLARR